MSRAGLGGATLSLGSLRVHLKPVPPVRGLHKVGWGQGGGGGFSGLVMWPCAPALNARVREAEEGTVMALRPGQGVVEMAP